MEPRAGRSDVPPREVWCEVMRRRGPSFPGSSWRRALAGPVGSFVTGWVCHEPFKWCRGSALVDHRIECYPCPLAIRNNAHDRGVGGARGLLPGGARGLWTGRRGPAPGGCRALLGTGTRTAGPVDEESRLPKDLRSASGAVLAAARGARWRRARGVRRFEVACRALGVLGARASRWLPGERSHGHAPPKKGPTRTRRGRMAGGPLASGRLLLLKWWRLLPGHRGPTPNQ